LHVVRLMPLHPKTPSSLTSFKSTLIFSVGDAENAGTENAGPRKIPGVKSRLCYVSLSIHMTVPRFPVLRFPFPRFQSPLSGECKLRVRFRTALIAILSLYADWLYTCVYVIIRRCVRAPSTCLSNLSAWSAGEQG